MNRSRLLREIETIRATELSDTDTDRFNAWEKVNLDDTLERGWIIMISIQRLKLTASFLGLAMVNAFRQMLSSEADAKKFAMRHDFKRDQSQNPCAGFQSKHFRANKAKLDSSRIRPRCNSDGTKPRECVANDGNEATKSRATDQNCASRQLVSPRRRTYDRPFPLRMVRGGIR